jgi:hypothetical protein
MTMAETHHPCSTILRDAQPDHGDRLPIRLVVSPNGVSLHAEGYGDRTSAAGHGTPVFIELYRGELRVILWTDINEEDPTHVIPLDGAKEGRRRADDGE